MSATTRTEQVAWLEANLTYFPPDKQEQVKATLALEGLPDIVISSLYTQFEEQMADIVKAAEEEAKIAEKVEELFQAELDKCDEWWTNKWIKILTVKDKDGKTKTTGYKITDRRIACLLLHTLTTLEEDIKKAARPKKAGGGKKLSGTRRKKGDTDAWYINTEEEAKGEYKKGVWACKTDIEAGSVYEDNMKIYKAGESDPRGGDKALAKDLTKYQFKAPVRTDNIYDADDTTRCKGAVGWKAGRYGCKFAHDNGFKGSVMGQCSSKAVAGGYCSKCAKGEPVDFFDKSNKYIKANIAWCEAFDGEFIKIE